MDEVGATQKEIRKLKSDTTMVYMLIYAVFQIILLLDAYYNNILENYSQLILSNLVVGPLAFLITLHFEGLDVGKAQRGKIELMNLHKLVFYAACLLSLGQLVQSAVYHKNGFESYQKSFQTSFIVMLIACLLMVFFLRYCVKHIPDRLPWMTILQWGLVALTFMILFIIRFSPLKGMENGAYISISIGGHSLQVMEFIKPLAVIVTACFMYKPDLKEKEVFFAMLYIAAVTGFCAVLCNEFGTGITVLLMGGIIIFTSQNAKLAWAFIILPIVGLLLIWVLLMEGKQIYRNLPASLSDEIWAEEFTACCTTRNELAETVSGYLAVREKEDQKPETQSNNYKEGYVTLEQEEQRITESLKEKGISLNDAGFSYEWFINYLYNGVQNKFLATSYMKDEQVDSYDDDPFNEQDKENRKTFLTIMTVIASSSAENQSSLFTNFRSYYYNHILDRMVYSDRFQEAYERAGGSDKSLKAMLFKIYCKVVYKVQYRVSGLTNPEKEAMGAAYQVNTARAAMATGGWFGNGDIHYTSEIYAADSDMVFASAVAELGTVAGILIIVLTMLIFKEFMFAALAHDSLFLEEICAGMGLTWFIQAMLMVLGNCRLSILTGMTIPLVANGGMSLLDSALMITLVVCLTVSIDSRSTFTGVEMIQRRSKNRGRRRKTGEKAFHMENAEETPEENRKETPEEDPKAEEEEPAEPGGNGVQLSFTSRGRRTASKDRRAASGKRGGSRDLRSRRNRPSFTEQPETEGKKTFSDEDFMAFISEKKK